MFAFAGVGAYLTGLRGRRLKVPEQPGGPAATGFTAKGNEYRNASLRFAIVALLAFAALTAVILVW